MGWIEWKWEEKPLWLSLEQEEIKTYVKTNSAPKVYANQNTVFGINK